MKLYSNRSMQVLINYKWHQFQGAIYALQIIPFTLILVVFMFWSNFILLHSHSAEGEDIIQIGETGHSYRWADVMTSFLLLILTTFFMLTEVESFIRNPLSYMFYWGENLTDLLPLILLYISIFWSLGNEGTLPFKFWVIQSLAGMSLWVKFIWFLRS